jgi:hypothetical protein
MVEQGPVDSEPEEEHEPLAREGEHIPPAHEARAYHCPYCGVLAPMQWTQLGYSLPDWTGTGLTYEAIWTAECQVCRDVEQLQPQGNDLDDRIGKLVGKGLPEEVAHALDVLRVVGNNSVHPGELDMRDDVATATALFECINHIVEERIARPQRIGGLFAKLPERARQAIDRRNARHAPAEADSEP